MLLLLRQSQFADLKPQAMARHILSLILLLGFVANASAQTYLYVHPLVGSDSLSGTRGTVIAGTRAGPKATIEGAVKAAAEGTTTAIILLYGEYDKDERGVVDENGIEGGNDADGITIAGNKNILIGIRHAGTLRFTTQIKVDVPEGRSVVIQNDIGNERPDIVLEKGFFVASGDFRWNMDVNEVREIAGKSTIQAGGRFIVDKFVKLNGSLTIESGGYLENNSRLDLEKSGYIENGGHIDTYGDMFRNFDGSTSLPFEESNTYLLNSASGTINMLASDVAISGQGIIENRGTIYSAGIGNARSSLGQHLLNLGTIEVESGTLNVGNFRTAFENEDGGTLTIRNDATVIATEALLSPNALWQGVGTTNFSACVIEGTIAYQGELYLENCTVTETAQLDLTGTTLWLLDDVSVQQPITVPHLYLNASPAVQLEHDIRTDVLDWGGEVSGAGHVIVDSLIIMERSAHLLGPGAVELYGAATATRYSMTIDSEFIVHDEASLFANRASMGGAGILRVMPGGTFDIYSTDSYQPAETLTLVNEGTTSFVGTANTELRIDVENRGVFLLGDGSYDTGLNRTLTHFGNFTNEVDGKISGMGILNIENSNFSNAGTINPDAEDALPPTISIEGNLTLTPSSILEIDALETVDLIDLNGDVALEGALNVVFPADSLPLFDIDKLIFSFANATGNFANTSFTLPARYAGADASIEANDSAYVFILTNYNQLPIAIADTVMVPEGDSSFIDVLANDFDAYGDPLFIISTTGNRTEIFDNGTPDDPSDDLIKYFHPYPDYNGSDSFFYTISDGGSGIAHARVQIDIQPVDDPIEFRTPPLTGASVDLPYLETIQIVDIDNDIESAQAVKPDWLTFEQAQSPNTYILSGTPTTEDIGQHLVEITASSSSGTAIKAFALNVTSDLNFSPAHESEVATLPPTLTWNSIPDAVSYRLQLAREFQISDDSTLAFRFLVDSTGLTNPAFSVPEYILQPPFTYEWRVGAVSEAGVIDWSGVSKFTVLPQPQLPAPLLSVPENGVANLPLPIAATWEEVLGATSYTLVVSTDSLFSSFASFANTQDTQALIENLDGSRRYFWRVIASDGFQTGAWSEVRSFTVEPFPTVFSQQAAPPGTPYLANVDLDNYHDALFVSKTAPSTVLLRGGEQGVFESDPIDTSLPNIQGTAAWSDFDRDGDPDLILAGKDVQGTLATRLYTVEDGTFNEQASTLPAVRSVVSWGRLDNDGDFDLLLSDVDESGDGITYLVENTDLGFSTRRTFELGGIASWADIDQDGDDDLLIGAGANSTESGFTIYRNDVDTLIAIETIDDINVHAVAWGDYDSDQDLDLVVSGMNSAGVFMSLFRYNAGVFEQTPLSAASAPGTELSWRDFDNDGDLDLLMLNAAGAESAAMAYINEESQLFATPMYANADYVISDIIWLDIDRDLDADLLLKSTDGEGDWFQIRKNLHVTANRTPDEPINARLVETTKNSATIAWDPPEDDNTPESQLRYNIRLRSLPSGLPAMTTEIPLDFGGTYPAKNFLVPERTNYTTSSSITITGLAADSIYQFQVQAVDLQGVPGDFSWRLFLGASQFTVFTGDDEYDESLGGIGDFDGDGDIDVFQITNPGRPERAITLFNQEDNAFSPTETTLGDFSILGSDVADYDNDGDLDILMHPNSENWGIFENNNGFSASAFTPIGGTEFTAGFWADWDMDNDLDFLTGHGTVINRYTFENGQYASEPEEFDTDIVFSTLSPGDFDGDGDPDLFLGGQHKSAILRNEEGRLTPRFSGIPNEEYNAGAWGDFDADGDLDLALTEPVGQVIYRNDDGLFVRHLEIATNNTTKALAWGDADNDGDLDLFAIGFSNVELLINEGSRFTSQNNLLNVGFDGFSRQNPVLLDVDGDNDLDIAYQNLILRNTTTSINQPPSAPEALRVEILDDGKTARLSWEPAEDDTTPPMALSYNVNIGHESGKGDVLNAMSILHGEFEGRRTRRGPGNAGNRLHYTLYDLQPGISYFWRVQAIDNSAAGGKFSAEVSFTTEGINTSIDDNPGELIYNLEQNYPNPFNPRTNIRFSIPEVEHVELTIYNALGQQVGQLVNAQLLPGRYEFAWEANRYASGVYFAHLKTNAYAKVIKMTLVK